MGLLWLPMLDTFFHFDYAPAPNEKRLLAAFPKLEPGVGGLKKYLAGLEAYFNDHFGCRKCLVLWNNKWKWELFRDQSLRHESIVGRDGWLYLAECQMVEHYRGVLQLTPQDLSDWQMLLERRRDWLAQRGIKYIFVIAPDKPSIYPEFLPLWLTKVRPETKLDQFFAYMRAHSTVEVLDLRAPLIAARKIAPTYFQTGTHWNQFGAFESYQDLIKALSKDQLPGLMPVPLESFDLTNRLEPGSDLADFLGLTLTESNAVHLIPKPGLPPLETSVVPRDKPGPLFTKNPQARGCAIVFQDSFGRYWAPFLGYNFGEVGYVWQYNFDPALIEKKNPMVIISEMVERNFNVTDPGKLQAGETLK